MQTIHFPITRTGRTKANHLLCFQVENTTLFQEHDKLMKNPQGLKNILRKICFVNLKVHTYAFL